MSDYSKYNQAVLSTSQKESISSARSNLDESKQNLNTSRNDLLESEKDLNKKLKMSSLGGNQYSTESILSAKKQIKNQKLSLQNYESELNTFENEIITNENKINSDLSIIKTASQLEQLGYKKEISGNKTTYYTESRYRRKRGDDKITFRSKEFTFTNGIPTSFIERDDYNTGTKRKVATEKEISFTSSGSVSRVKLYDDGEREETQYYDNKGRISEETFYRDGDKSKRNYFNYNDESGTYTKETKKYSKKSSKVTAKNSYEVTNSDGISFTRTNYSDGTIKDTNHKSEIHQIKIKTDKLTGTITEDYLGKSGQTVRTIKKTPVSQSKSFTLTPKMQKDEQLQREVISQMQKDYIQKTNQQNNLKLEFNEAKPKPVNSYENTKWHYKEMISNDNPLKKGEHFVKMTGFGIKTAATEIGNIQRGFRTQEQAAKDFNLFSKKPQNQDLNLTTSQNVQKHISDFSSDLKGSAPMLTEGAMKISTKVGTTLAKTGSEILSWDMVNNKHEDSIGNFKQSLVDKQTKKAEESVEQFGKGLEQFEQKGIKNKITGTYNIVKGSVDTLAAETSLGILQPNKAAKTAEKAFMEVPRKEGSTKDLILDTAEVVSGGGAYLSEYGGNPKKYLGDELIENSVLFIAPTKRVNQMADIIINEPKSFLKSSLGESLFVSGVYGAGKFSAQNVEVSFKNDARYLLNEVSNLELNSKTKSLHVDNEVGTVGSVPVVEYNPISFSSAETKFKSEMKKPKGIETDGEYAYQTEHVTPFLNELVNTMPEMKFRKPKVTFSQTATISAGEIAFINGNSFTNSNAEIVINEYDNKSELKFPKNNNIFNSDIKNDNKFHSELKFDEKYDTKFKSEIRFEEKFKLDNKVEMKTDTKFKSEMKFDNRYETKYENKFEQKFDTKFDMKFKFDLFGGGKNRNSRQSKVKDIDNFKKYIPSLGGVLLDIKSTKPTKDITGLKVRGIIKK